MFKVGDRVKATTGWCPVVKCGDIYEVNKVGANWLSLKGIEGYYFNFWDFELVEEESPVFKVGDKVECVETATCSNLFSIVKGELHIIDGISGGYLTFCGKNGFFSKDNFKLAPEPCKPEEKPAEVKIGDVWGSDDKKEVVKIVGRYKVFNDMMIAFYYLKSSVRGKGEVGEVEIERFKGGFPLLLHRKPEKPKAKPMQKPKEEWKLISIDTSQMFDNVLKAEVYTKGTLTKAVCGDIVAYASPHAPDVYDAKRGEQVAVAKCYAEWLLKWAKGENK